MRYYRKDIVEVIGGHRFVGDRVYVLRLKTDAEGIFRTSGVVCACNGMDSYGCRTVTEVPFTLEHIRLAHRPRFNHLRAVFTIRARN